MYRGLGYLSPFVSDIEVLDNVSKYCFLGEIYLMLPNHVYHTSMWYLEYLKSDNYLETRNS